MAPSGRFVHGFTLLQDESFLPAVALIRRHLTDRTVSVLVVVPLHEAVYPFPGCLDAIEGFVRVSRTVLQCPEQALRVRVVIAHRRTAEPFT